MRASELKKILIKNGCYKAKEGRNHETWFSPSTGKYFSVTRHNSEEIATGTLSSILKSAGLK